MEYLDVNIFVTGGSKWIGTDVSFFNFRKFWFKRFSDIFLNCNMRSKLLTFNTHLLPRAKTMSSEPNVSIKRYSHPIRGEQSP